MIGLGLLASFNIAGIGLSLVRGLGEQAGGEDLTGGLDHEEGRRPGFRPRQPGDQADRDPQRDAPCQAGQDPQDEQGLAPEPEAGEGNDQKDQRSTGGLHSQMARRQEQATDGHRQAHGQHGRDPCGLDQAGRKLSCISHFAEQKGLQTGGDHGGRAQHHSTDRLKAWRFKFGLWRWLHRIGPPKGVEG